MKDRYKFRGLRGDSHLFAYGSLQVNEEGHCTIWMDDKSQRKGGMVGYSVHPETVGQCTGLVDTKGDLIYEGDILESESRHSDNGFRLDVVSYVLTNYTSAFNFHASSGAHLTSVVGNIHENKEILEEKNDGS